MYSEMSEEDQIRVAIDFVAQGQPVPEPLVRFLKEAGIYEAIVTPGVIESEGVYANG